MVTIDPIRVFRTSTTHAAQINAAAEIQVTPSDRDRREFAPFNVLMVTNEDSTCTIKVTLNDDDDDVYYVQPKQTMSIAPEDGITFWFFNIANTHASSNIAANLIHYHYATVVDREAWKNRVGR